MVIICFAIDYEYENALKRCLKDKCKKKILEEEKPSKVSTVILLTREN